MDIFSLSGKTALVAGASRGIGLAIAQAMAAAGAHVVLASRSRDVLEARACELMQQGLKASALEMDIADPEAVRKAADSIETPDILVNVAGMNVRKRFEKYTPEEYDRILSTNLHGIVALTQRIGAGMIARGQGGKIISIGSLTTLVGFPYVSVYAISKGALGQLTKVLAAEWARYNIQVNCIAPGFIVTDLNREMWEQPQMHDWLKGSQANPSPGRPADVAPVAVFLASRAAGYVTGQIIAVDGGFTTTSVWPFEPPAEP